MAKFLSDDRCRELLGACPLFAEVSPQGVERLVRHAESVQYPKGAFLVKRGETPASLMLMAQGEALELVVDRNDLSSVAKTHYPGAFFAELSLILDLPSATSVVARTRVVILAVAKEAFLELFWASPQMIRSVIALQSDRLMQAAERSASHTMIRTEGRLAFALVTLGQEGGQTGTVSVTHEFLGQYCGLARQTVTVILSEWQRQGLIETGYRKIRLLNPDGLTRIFLSDQNYRG